MKKLFKEEKNKLPLTFKFIEKLGSKKSNDKENISTNYIKCETYQTDYLMRERPIKALTRLL
ncbi:hypothetical protein DRF65_26630 [Chryseobacterium pennae]|uniref:Uncharacterized protein n=1 Tax=Chryseobacterium pennae TaxID=2258962 RepID=A0A3D9C0R6_9FLAO|nr:hypothetical protein DRF65_26630 [Chryseobacterium pennae]